jgi:hypothetical protein
MAFYFVSTFAIAQTPTKQPALQLSRTKNLHFAKATVTRTNRGAEGIGGRVKFLPLAWAGMPKTSFRKNSDSRTVLFLKLTPTKQPALQLSRTKNLHFAKATFPGFSAAAVRPASASQSTKAATLKLPQRLDGCRDNY